jgi:hypothetical protein
MTKLIVATHNGGNDFIRFPKAMTEYCLEHNRGQLYNQDKIGQVLKLRFWRSMYKSKRYFRKHTVAYMLMMLAIAILIVIAFDLFCAAQKNMSLIELWQFYAAHPE